MGYSPFSRKESETTEQLTLSLMTQEGGGNQKSSRHKPLITKCFVFNIYLLVWLCQVLVVALRISCSGTQSL